MGVDFSLEVFPPKNIANQFSLWRTINSFLELQPKFISVTYGAGGNTPSFTLETAEAISSNKDVSVAAHMTCFGCSKEQIETMAHQYWQKGIRHIVALRGDQPKNSPAEPVSDFKYGADLVTFLKTLHDFEISVAGYPEVHPEAQSLDEDLTHLKEKVDAGANRVITQFFFDPEVFLKFRERATAIGIEVPIIPGILPILNFKRMMSFAEKCQIHVPDFLHEMFGELDSRSLEHQLLAMNILTHQVTRLIEEGVDFFHFYTLNETIETYHVCRWLRAAFPI